MKTGRKLMIFIPIGFVLLLAIAIGVMYLAIGRGGVLSILSTLRFRTHMMQPEVYEDPSGLSLPYRVYVPETMEEGAPRYPVVLFLQGGGHRGTDNRRQTNAFGVMHVLLGRSNRAKYPCILVAPQMPLDGDWGDDELRRLHMGMLEQIAANYPADPARTYVTGLSLGGGGTWAMLAAYPEYFAAGVPICGWWTVEDAPLLKDIPVWIFHGENDRPENARAMFAALKEAGSARVKYTEYPKEGHWSWGRAYYDPALYEWMFAQAKQ